MKISSLASVIARTAVACSVVLLIANAPFTSARAENPWLSALPLALVGVAFAALQISLKPDRGTLLKRLLLAAAFVLWAVDQVLPAGRVATLIGDIVISAYVLDLFWMIDDQRRPEAKKALEPEPASCCEI